MTFDVGVQHIQHIELKEEIQCYTKEVLYARLIERNNPKIKSIPLRIEYKEGEDDDQPYILSDTYTLEHTKRILCAYSSIPFGIKGWLLREFDAKTGEFGCQRTFQHSITGLAELPEGDIAISVGDQHLWIVSPDLQTLRQPIVHGSYCTTTILSSFLNGFVFVATPVGTSWQTMYYIIYSEYQPTNKRWVDHLSYHDIAMCSHDRGSYCSFHFRGNSFLVNISKLGRLSSEDHRIEGTYNIHYFGGIEKHDVRLCNTGLFSDDIVPLVDPIKLITFDYILVRVEPRDQAMCSLVGYWWVKEEAKMMQCFDFSTNVLYDSLLLDTKDPRCFYAIKENGDVDHFRLVYPRQSLINLCCQTLASIWSTSYLDKLREILPEELLETTESFLPTVQRILSSKQ